jgi:hypothetical protein
VAGNVVRNADGKLNINEVPAAQPTDPAAKGPWGEYMTWLTDKGKDADATELWKKYQEYRRKSAEKKAEEAKAGKTAAAKVALDYDPDLRWERERRDPLVRADSIEIKNLSFRMTDRSAKGGGIPSLTSVAMSTMPGWNGQPIHFSGNGLLADGKSGKLLFIVSWLPSKCEGGFSIEEVPVTDFKGFYEKSVPVNVDAGVATLSTKADVNAGMIDGKVVLKITKLKISPKPGETKILGLDAQTSGYAIQGINAYGEGARDARETGASEVHRQAGRRGRFDQEAGHREADAHHGRGEQSGGSRQGRRRESGRRLCEEDPAGREGAARREKGRREEEGRGQKRPRPLQEEGPQEGREEVVSAHPDGRRDRGPLSLLRRARIGDGHPG